MMFRYYQRGPALPGPRESTAQVKQVSTVSVQNINIAAAYLLTRIMAQIYMYSRRRGEEILQMA
jgi:hypothetical protein